MLIRAWPLLLLAVVAPAVADPATDKELENQIYEAADKKDAAALEAILRDHPGASLNDTDWKGRTPLALAAENGAHDVAMLLVKGGADVNKTPQGRYSPLWNAASSGDKELVAALLAAGAKVDATLEGQDSPLGRAAGRGDLEVAQMLIAHGADVNFKGFGGNPLIPAVDRYDRAMAEMLIAHGADVNFVGYNGTAIERAAYHTDIGMAMLLLKHKADINARDPKGQTALDWSQKNTFMDATRRKDMADFLRKHGAVSGSSGTETASAPRKRSAAEQAEIQALIHKNTNERLGITDEDSGPSPKAQRLAENAKKAALALGYRVESERGKSASYRNGDMTLETEWVQRGDGTLRFTAIVGTRDSDARELACRKYRAVFFKLMGIESAEKAGMDLDGDVFE